MLGQGHSLCDMRKHKCALGVGRTRAVSLTTANRLSLAILDVRGLFTRSFLASWGTCSVGRSTRTAGEACQGLTVTGILAGALETSRQPRRQLVAATDRWDRTG